MQNSVPNATLSPGDRLGHYEIDGFLAAGGMGEVYRAKDLSLQRVVAIKLLPPDVAADPERRERFEREARTIAALNHPNIVTVHSVERDGARMFITMELVDGRPLNTLIPNSGYSFEQLLALAVPLANAVSAAHDQGITHRDLKPANVIVKSDGTVKVLDFGIAKRHDVGASSGLATTAALATAEGQLLGTVAYMSPEQAEGKPADRRSDVFSMGTILYEMATGQRPFSRDSEVATLAAIVRDAPAPIAEINPRVPAELARIIRRALAKDPDRRQQSAKDLRNELDDLRQELASGEWPAAPTAAMPHRRPIGWIAAAAVVIAMLGVMAWGPRQSLATPDAGADALTVGTLTTVTVDEGLEHFPSISPDGKWVVYTADERSTGQTDILLRAVGGLTAINLTRDSPADESQPVFSRDGERIAFRSEREGGGLYVMNRTGESVRRITKEGFNPSWSPDGRELAYAEDPVIASPRGRGPRSHLWVVGVESGERRRLIDRDAVQPSWSPHGRRIAFWAMASGDSTQRDIWTIAAAGGEPVRVTDDAATDWNPVWSPDGRHLYFSSDRAGSFGLWRVRIDEATGLPIGPPVPVAVQQSGLSHLSFSADGRSMVAAATADISNVERLEFDPVRARVTARHRLTRRSGTEFGQILDAPSVAPDGKRLAYIRARDLWIESLDGSSVMQLTSDAARDNRVRFSPDGKSLLFDSERGGRFQVWRVNTDGSGMRQVFDHPGIVQSPVWSPDGKRAVAFRQNVPELLLFDPLRPAGEQHVEKLETFADGFMPFSWSPDGLSIAGQIPRPAGGLVIYSLTKRAYERFSEDGQAPVWMPDSRRLLYRTQNELRLFDTATRASTAVFSSPTETLGSVGMSGDARRLYLYISKSQGDIVMGTLGDRTF